MGDQTRQAKYWREITKKNQKAVKNSIWQQEARQAMEPYQKALEELQSRYLYDVLESNLHKATEAAKESVDACVAAKFRYIVEAANALIQAYPQRATEAISWLYEHFGISVEVDVNYGDMRNLPEQFDFFAKRMSGEEFFKAHQPEFVSAKEVWAGKDCFIVADRKVSRICVEWELIMKVPTDVMNMRNLETFKDAIEKKTAEHAANCAKSQNESESAEKERRRQLYEQLKEEFGEG